MAFFYIRKFMQHAYYSSPKIIAKQRFSKSMTNKNIAIEVFSENEHNYSKGYNYTKDIRAFLIGKYLSINNTRTFSLVLFKLMLL